MSNKVQVLSPAINSVLHPNRDLNPDPIIRSANGVREFEVAANGGASDSNMSFSTKLPSGTVLDRCIFIEYEVEYVFQSPRDTIDYGETDFSPACIPLHRCMKNLTVTINGHGQTISPQFMRNALLKYHNTPTLQESHSMCPAQPDLFNNAYIQGKLTNGQPLHPQSPYQKLAGEFGVASESRAAFQPTATVTITAGTRDDDVTAAADSTVTVRYKFREPLFHPFLSDVLGRDILAQVQNLQIDMTMLSNLKPMMVIGHTSDATSRTGCLEKRSAVRVSALSTPKLLLRTYVPPVAIPQRMSHQYYHIYSQQVVHSSAVALDASDTINTGNMSFSAVPHRLYFFVTRTGDYTLSDQADCYGAITGMTIRTSADQGGLSGADQVQLYQMSKRNGLTQTFTQFSQWQGSVVCVDIANSDLGGWTADAQVPFTFDAQITFKNTTFGTYDAVGTLDAGDAAAGGRGVVTQWTLHVVAQTSGVLVCEDGSAYTQFGHSPQQVAEALNSENIVDYNTDHHLENHVSGGGFFKDFRKGFAKGFGMVMSPAVKGLSVAGLVSPQARGAAMGLGALNSGVQRVGKM